MTDIIGPGILAAPIIDGAPNAEAVGIGPTVVGMVAGKFKTTEGWHVSLRERATGLGLGNYPIEPLGGRR